MQPSVRTNRARFCSDTAEASCCTVWLSGQDLSRPRLTEEAGMNPVTVGLYARSSARDQIAGQLQDLHAFATDHGWGTFEYINQGMSGVTSQRPALDAMLAAARAGRIAVVVVTSVDRLTRSCIQMASLIEELTDLRIALVVLDRVPDKMP